MEKENNITFSLWGRYALFTDPITRIGGEKCSYHIPTYQALKGITEAIYWKPTITWVIDKVRIMNKIQTQSMGVKPQKYNKYGNDLSIYTYLSDVSYQVSAHFEWNEMRKDLLHDRNENKHYDISKRMLARGGRRDIFLGTRECAGYVEECIFGDGVGVYDNDNVGYGIMFHGFDYPSETGREELGVRLWNATMKSGVVSFIRPNDCKINRVVREMSKIDRKTLGANEPLLQEILKEQSFYINEVK